MRETTTTTIYEVHFHFYYEHFDRDFDTIEGKVGMEHIRYFDTYNQAIAFLFDLDNEYDGKIEETEDEKGYKAVSIAASSWIEEVKKTRYYGLI